MASSRYPWPSTINVANFISTKLWFDQTSTNHKVWKAQMLCLIEGQDLLGFIDGTISPPETHRSAAGRSSNDDYLLWRRTDMLLKGWIFGSLSENMVSEVFSYETSRDVWLYLEDKSSYLSDQLQFHAQNLYARFWSDKEKYREDKDMIDYLPLHKAALEGDWETARRIFGRSPGSISAALNTHRVTPLQVAVGTGKRSIHFVREMVEMMMMQGFEELIIAQNNFGETALYTAAAVGNTVAATILASRAPRLLYIPNVQNNFPVQIAAVYGHRRMLQYLISVTTEPAPYEGMAGLRLLLHIIDAEFFDVALMLVDKYPYLAKLRLNGESALSALAAKESAFTDGSAGRGCFRFWLQRVFPYGTGVIPGFLLKRKMNEQARSLLKCLCEKLQFMRYEEARSIANDAMMIAARLGIHNVIEMIVEAFPDAILAWQPDSDQFIFHVAVLNRSEHVFNLIYQMSDHKYKFSDLTDRDGNNLLHAAGKLAPSHKLNQISGAALQMQREIQWFKEVEILVNPYSRKRPNKEGKTPKMVFREEHKNLKEEGEKWMKETSGSCTITAALIVTIMFAAAITVPGGNDNSSGFPVFSKDPMFLVFAISDAVSLFSSTTSLLMFLSILTSRYAEEDFLYGLPKRLIIALGTLLFSITFMMVAFSATLYLVFGQKKAWVLIPAAALACSGITLFVLLQFQLLVALVSSTFGRGIFGKHSNRPFY